MGKTDAIDFSADRLISIAAGMIEDHEYVSALKMLNKNAVLNGNDEDSYMLYAEAFDDMGLYEKCVNGWFKYIDYAAEGADLAEAYEGLALSFMNLGQDNFAAFYYNKLLMETDEELTPESRQEIIDAFLSTEKPPLKFAYPPRLADFSDEIESGVEFMRKSEYENAIDEFSKVREGNEKYLAARNFIAMCQVICDRNEQAEAECREILKRDSGNVQALTTLAAVKSQQHDFKGAKELTLRLLELAPDNSEEIYKIATVCCENGLHEQAYELFCKLDERYIYDCSLLFFKAIAAYNCGKADKSIETFDTLLTVYPNAVTAEYWYYEVLAELKKKPERRKDLGYFYRLPKPDSEANVSILTAYNSLSDSLAEKMCSAADISGAIHWCLDEGDGIPSYELKLLGAVCAVKAGMDDAVRDILLDAFLQDGIKMEVLSALVLKNVEGEYGVVICNLYKRVRLAPLELGKQKKKLFMRAYALAFSRFAMLSENYPQMLATATKTLYSKLEGEDRLAACRSIPAVAAAIVRLSAINESGLSYEQICDFFGTDEEKVNKIIGELQQ